MNKKIVLLIMVFFLFLSCKSQKIALKPNSKLIADKSNIQTDYSKQEPNDATFVNLKDFSDKFEYDMKYATDKNFLKTKVYDCAECFLRYKTVKALIAANNSFLKLGIKIKLFDCYRPLDVQKKMWKIVSNPDYVANPAKGSIHNRGGAVDITLVDKFGNELDMGTAFDFFGKEAAHNFLDLPVQVIKNRQLLKSVMVENNFKVFDSEWWHYNLSDTKSFKISNFKWDCK